MKKSIQCIVLGLVLCVPIMTQAAKPVFLITPVQKAPTIIYAGQTATATYQVTNNTPYDLNGNGVIGLPKGVVQVGGSCSNPFNLASGANCILGLQIVADSLQGDVDGGPVVCNTLANPLYCSRPLGNELHVVKSNSPSPTSVISASPTLLNLTEGGAAQTVTVINSSPTTAVDNLQVSIPGISAITIDPVNTTCTSTLTANSSCHYSFLPGAQAETNTIISINGSNTVGAVTVTANVSAVIINLSSPTLSFAVGNTGSVTVSNTSISTAVADLQVIIPVTSHITVANTSTCTVGGTIAASGSCILVLTTAVNVPTEIGTVITIQGHNTNAPTMTVTTTAAALSVTSPTLPQTLNANGTSTVSVSVRNTGTNDANNVQMSSPWTGVTFNPSSCGTITVGSTCTFSISSSTPNVAGQITIQGTDTNAATTPYIAFSYQGYLVFSTTGASPGTAKVLDARTSNPPFGWDSAALCKAVYVCTVTNATSSTNGQYLDGSGNSLLIIGNPPSATAPHIGTQVPTGGNAAATCYNVISDNTGSSPPTTVSNGTWYLPAICEMGAAGQATGCTPGAANIYSNLTRYGFGGFDTQLYWSSTESGSSYAWGIYLSGIRAGTQYVVKKGDAYNPARCVRAIAY